MCKKFAIKVSGNTLCLKTMHAEKIKHENENQQVHSVCVYEQTITNLEVVGGA